MKPRRISLISFIIASSIINVSCISYTPESLEGTYINKNYHYDPFLPDIPYKADTLFLKRDNTFTSKFWGNGIYKVINSPRGSKLDLLYNNYDKSKAGYQMNIKEYEGNLRLILFSEKDHYYLKVE